MYSTFGHLFKVSTWGESHGRALGCTLDGCPPGVRLDLDAGPNATESVAAVVFSTVKQPGLLWSPPSSVWIQSGPVPI